MSISGFTIVRNAEILDYPLRESVLSVLPICSEFIINCGDSTDNTLKICEELQREYPQKIRVFTSQWQVNNQTGGYQLKSQTDAALAACTHDWCLYIQADEVMHEEDLPKILKAKEVADQKPEVDGLLFDYLHFYGNYNYTIRGRNWYRKEVRLFKNHRKIEAFRDAQGFRKNQNRLLVIPSGGRVFHYGYVRNSESMKKKSTEMSRWWGSKVEDKPENFELINHIGLTKFQNTHPKLMQTSIQEKNFAFNPKECRRKWDKNEIKNTFTLLWESIFPFRIGEYRNYEIQ